MQRIKNLVSAGLAKKTVGLLVTQDLADFRSSLIGKMATSTVNRNCNALKAALNLAANRSDGRITNRDAWTIGLKALNLTIEPRNVILPEPTIRAIIASCYKVSAEFGEYIETLAVTGTRTSQADRLNGEDVELGRKPRLMMPSSRKGKKKPLRFPVPISIGLANRLSGRSGRLFSHPDGRPWNDWDRRYFFAKAVKAAGFDPVRITPYALRHSSIVRQLLANVPIRVVAATHDTSVKMIEQTYSRYILDHSDDLARSAMLDATTATVHQFPAKEATAG
jgi:integrase